MDRRQFIKMGGAAVAATALGDGTVMRAAEAGKTGSRKWSSEEGEATEKDLLVRFLGTGAADWKGVDERGEYRRNSSILVDGRLMIDFTKRSAEMLPDGFTSPEVLFYTHSHGDHFNPAAAMKILHAKKIYVGETWYYKACKGLAEAAAEVGQPMPEVIPLSIGQKVQSGDITVTALPANHAIGQSDEQALMYLLEKGGVRLLYATDTAGIPVKAARIVGLDAHVKDGKPITGLIMEATMGIDHDEDYRMFTHSSVGTVLRTAHVLANTGRLAAPAGQPVYLTHMARTLHGTQAELDSRLPEPLRAAFDGLEVIFRL